MARWLAVPLGSFPWSTLAVNVIGSFLFGIAWVVFERSAIGGPAARLAIFVGFLGAFTTFSTFAFETAYLIEHERWGLATVSLLAQNLGALFGVFAGLGLARAVANS